MHRELRFGVITIQNVPWQTLAERWRYLDELGFDSAWVADHFTNYRQQPEPWLECWTLLSALATHTERIRVGTMVTNITFHNPAVLARQALRPWITSPAAGSGWASARAGRRVITT